MKHFKFLFDSGEYFETFAFTFKHACESADAWMKRNSKTAHDIAHMEEIFLPMTSTTVH